MRATENYELNLLDAEDFVNREVLNENTEKIDEVLKTLEEPEHDTTKQAEVEELESGESLKVALRKLAKAVADYISHKADKVAHITAEERTAWNAKLGTEKIVANLTTTEAGMLLDATMGKKLQDQVTTNANSISTLNSNKIGYSVYKTHIGVNSTVELTLAINRVYMLIVSGEYNVTRVQLLSTGNNVSSIQIVDLVTTSFFTVSAVSKNSIQIKAGDAMGKISVIELAQSF